MVFNRQVKRHGLSFLAATALCSCTPLILDALEKEGNPSLLSSEHFRESEKDYSNSQSSRQSSLDERLLEGLALEVERSLLTNRGSYHSNTESLDFEAFMSSKRTLAEYFFRHQSEGFEEPLFPQESFLYGSFGRFGSREQEAQIGHFVGCLGKKAWEVINYLDNPVSNTLRSVKETSEGVVKNPLQKLFGPDSIDFDVRLNREGLHAGFILTYLF